MPLSLGDSFEGFDVVGTNSDFFKYYRYSSGKLLKFSKGGNFKGFFDLIVGHNVAKKLHLKLGDKVYLSHGSVKHKNRHKNRAFTVSGILKKSSTPNDDVVFMQLKTDEAIHIEWQSGHFVDMNINNEELSHMNIKPEHISGMLLGLKDRALILSVEDKINHYKGENLMAVIPAKALTKLYKLIKNLQDILMFISSMVFIAAIFTMLSSMLSTLNDRRREIAILRSLGANVKIVFGLFAWESFLMVFSGILLGMITLDILILFAPLGFEISLVPDIYELSLLLIMIFTALLASIVPAVVSYRHSLQDGLMVRI